MAYLPLPGELDVAHAIVQCLGMGKHVCVPDVNWDDRDMRPIELLSLNDASLRTTRYGVRVPREKVLVDPSRVDVVVVPGLAFDVSGHRLGRGGGFYDRFLAKLHAGAVKIAVAFEAQLVDCVPMAVTDVAVDVIVTEKRVIAAT